MEKLDLSKDWLMTFISSESCNLSCKYCEIASSINKKLHAEEALKVKQSLKDGTYWNNMKIGMKKYNVDPNKITAINLWGQEPTLTLNEVSDLLPEIFEYCPNLEGSLFSSNGVAYPDRIIHYIKTINNLATKTFNIEIQFSYDGSWSTTNKRGANPLIIFKNIKTIIEELNNIKLKEFITVKLWLHGVFTMDVLHEYMTSDNKIIEYWNDINDPNDMFIKFSTNPNVTIVPKTALALVNPYNASVQDGIDLADFIKRSKKLYFNTKNENIIYAEFFDALLNHMLQIDLFKNYTPIEIVELLNKYPNITNEEKNMIQEVSYLYSCSFAKGELKMRYNGQFSHCHMTIFGMQENELKNKTTWLSQVYQHLIDTHCFGNFLTEEDEPYVYNYMWKGKIYGEDCFPHIYSITVNLMVALAQSHQIDSSYINNYDKILRHALYVASYLTCWDVDLQCTGSGFGRSVGMIRFLCNGYIDLFEEELNRRKEQDNGKE